MPKHEWKKGISLDEELQVRLRAFVKERGEKKASEELQVSVTAIVRAAAGLGMRRGTILMIETKLGEAEKKAA